MERVFKKTQVTLCFIRLERIVVYPESWTGNVNRELGTELYETRIDTRASDACVSLVLFDKGARSTCVQQILVKKMVPP